MKKLITLLFCAVMLLGTASVFTASAASFDADRHGSLTIKYTDGTNGFESLEIVTYRIASVDSNGNFTMLPQFTSYPVNIYNVKTQAEWKNIADTLASYIISDELEPYSLNHTAPDGTVVMDNMETGLYLTLAVNAEKSGTVYAFENFFAVLPARNGSSWVYDVEAVPKKSQYSGHIYYRVTKLWQDSENPSVRPKNITIEILRNGTLWETQVLNAENNWSYYWQDPDGKGEWTVREKDVPDNYSVMINKNENVFSMVNKYEHAPAPSPTPTSSATPPPSPTATPTPEKTPTPGVTPTPTITPTPSTTPTVSPTATPSTTPQATSTPSVTQPPEDNKTPKPHKPTPPPPKTDYVPNTGDLSNVRPYFIMMCVSGLILIILGIFIGRRRR